MFDLCLCNVRTRYKEVTQFDVTTGVRQGSVIASLLSIAYKDTVIQKFREENMRQGTANVMVCADDTAECSDNKGKQEEALNCWTDCFTAAGVKLNRNNEQM